MTSSPTTATATATSQTIRHEDSTDHHSRRKLRRRTDSFFSRFSSGAPVDIPGTHDEEEDGISKVNLYPPISHGLVRQNDKPTDLSHFVMPERT